MGETPSTASARRVQPPAGGLDTVNTAARCAKAVSGSSGPRWQFSFRRTRYQTHGVRAEILRIDHAYFTKLNRSHLVTGRTALILPCLGRSEIDRQAQGPQICDSRGYHEHRKPL
jgi:hypothetical protein